MIFRKKNRDPEVLKISTKMEEIKQQNREAVKELKDLHKTLQKMERELRTLKGR